MFKLLNSEAFFVRSQSVQRFIVLSFKPHEWLRQNFSLQHQYNVNRISDENKEKYQFGDN